MRARALIAICVTAAACGVLGAGCGAARRSPTVSGGTTVGHATCPEGPFPPAPTTAGVSVHRAGPLALDVAPGLSGCPGAGAQLPSASFPYLGIACRVANRAGCDRVRVGVHLARPAILVAVWVDGRLVTLTPPTDPGSDLWQGALLGTGPRHGALAVRARHGYWYGEPPVRLRVRVTAYFADGTAATRAGVGYLHAGYG